MSPLTVLRSSWRPPLPIVALMCRGRILPVNVSGKSDWMEPFTVLASISALRSAGSSNVMLPFTVLSDRSPDQSARPMDSSMEPFTVWASALPVVEISTLPFTVRALTSALMPRASTLPFTVCPVKRTPWGTFTTKSTLTSLRWVLMCPPEPGSHRFSWLAFRGVGYTAQIVTPASLGTTSIRTEAGSLLCADFVATTSTSEPEVGSARTSPFTPLISTTCPDLSVPAQWKPPVCCAATGPANIAASTTAIPILIM